MVKKIFSLWNNHTTGFCRVLMVLLIPAAIFPEFWQIYCDCLLVLWLIVHTGYSKGWHKEGGEDER